MTSHGGLSPTGESVGGTAGPPLVRLCAGLTHLGQALTVLSSGGQRWKNRLKALPGGGGGHHPCLVGGSEWALLWGLRLTQ